MVQDKDIEYIQEKISAYQKEIMNLKAVEKKKEEEKQRLIKEKDNLKSENLKLTEENELLAQELQSRSKR